MRGDHGGSRLLHSYRPQRLSHDVTLILPLASFYSAAFAPTLDEECLTDEELSQACIDYGEKLKTLYSMIEEQVPKMEAVKSLATDLKAIKLNVAKSAPGPDSPEMREALKAAKAAEAEFGKGSPEAAVAWDNLEEIASSGLKNAMGTRLDQECLVDSAIEACQALEELDRALKMNKEDS